MYAARSLSLGTVSLGILALAASASAQGFNRDFDPTSREVVLDTNFTQIQPTNGPPVNVRGGVFTFRNVRIRQGVTVRGVGTNPMVWIVSGDFIVEGRLSVDGADGDRVNTLNSANFPAAGGAGACGGGYGGMGSPNAMARSVTGEFGFGPNNAIGGGGAPGQLDCLLACATGSGGGGGALATQGDPSYPLVTFQAVRGQGGQVCGPVPGGLPGVLPFTDGRDDNDFWGLAYDLNRGVAVMGELPLPIGGQGGGGGGDTAVSCAVNDPLFVNDSKGGGGGGGGGIVAVVAQGKVIVRGGRITANGGHGGGGEQAGSSNEAGGGGGGSGGMVLVFGGRGLELHALGETYANNNYEFCISADGGVCLTSGFGGGPVVTGKYPPVAQAYGNAALGGFGGMGVVQLYAPVGSNADNTNTILDDGIDVYVQGSLATGALKQRFLAWRGFRNNSGVRVDDFGQPTNIGANEGDIRPSPVLFPVLR